MARRKTTQLATAFGKWFECFAMKRGSGLLRSRRSHGSRRSPAVSAEHLESRQLLTSLTFDSVTLVPSGAGIDAVGADANGNTYMTGRFVGTVDFAPTTQLPGDADVLTARGSNDIFVAKYNPNNELVWVSRFGGDSTLSGYDLARAIAVDASGNIWLTGNFAESADFGGTILTSVGNRDIFLTKINTTGTVEWAVGFGGEGYDVPVIGFAVDDSGNATVGGRTTGVTPNARYLRQYDSNGGLTWNLDDLTSGDKASILQIDSDSAGNVFVAGAFLGNVDFDLSSDSDRIQGAGELENFFRNAYVSQYSANGTYGWTTAIVPGDGNGIELESTVLTAIAVDDLGEVALIGTYHDGSVNAVGSGNILLQPIAPVVADQHGYFVKLGATGNVQSSRTYWSVLDAPPISDIVATPDGYAALGRVANSKSFSPGPGVNVEGFGAIPGVDGSLSYATVLMELDSTGQITAAGTIGGVATVSSSFGASTLPIGISRTPTGELLVAGSTPSSSGVEVDYDPNPNATSDVKAPGGYVAQLSQLSPGDSVVLFKDDFEYDNWTTPSTLWTQDSQNDWFRSTQRSTTGTYAAEVDGSANNATLTTANVIDLSGMASATLTFDWLIESGFDAGEYLSLDISTNGGSTWTQDVRRLNGNVSTENVWHSETVDLSPYTSSELKIRFRSKVSASDEDADVDNVRIVGIVDGPNTAPVADAGAGYAMNEGDGVTLDASGSLDPDGTVVAYAWDLDNDGQYDDATGVSPTFSTTNSGIHTIGLQLTDNRGATATTTTTINVSNVAPVADAGSNQTGIVGNPIPLSAAASFDPGLDIVNYAWDLDNDGLFDDAIGVSATFPATTVGSFEVSVQVTDADGATSVDQVVVTINEAPSEVVLFEDSFEVSEWNGKWVEDSQNDWFRSSQRATDGTRSAEVDGLANNATLTTASSFDTTGYSAITLTFDWLIESGFDAGEYLTLDISTNGGASWISDVRRLNGDLSAEDVWHNESVDLTPYASTNLRIRFRSSVSSSTEDANVDNVRLVASNGSSSGTMGFAAASSTGQQGGVFADIQDTANNSLIELTSNAAGPSVSGTTGSGTTGSKVKTKSQSAPLVSPTSNNAIDAAFADFDSLLNVGLQSPVTSGVDSGVL